MSIWKTTILVGIEWLKMRGQSADNDERYGLTLITAKVYITSRREPSAVLSLVQESGINQKGLAISKYGGWIWADKILNYVFSMPR